MKEIDKIKQSVIVAATAITFALPYEARPLPWWHETPDYVIPEQLKNDADFIAVNFATEFGIPIDEQYRETVDIYTYLGLKLPTDSAANQAEFFLKQDILHEFSTILAVNNILPGLLNSGVEHDAILYMPDLFTGGTSIIIKTDKTLASQALFYNIDAAISGKNALQTTNEIIEYFYGEADLGNLVDAQNQSLHVVKVNPSLFRQSVQNRITILGPQLTEVEKVTDVVALEELGLYGNYRGWGSTAFEDLDQQYSTTDEMVAGVANEITYLENHLGLTNAAVNFDLTTMHEHYRALEHHVYNDQTPEIVNKLNQYYQGSGRIITFSLNFAPPPGYSMTQVEQEVDKLFRGEIPGFSSDWLVDNIMSLHLSFDPEPMTWGRPGEQDQIESYINWNDMLKLNATYVNAHLTIQAERLRRMGITPSWENLIIPDFDFYNFGTGDWDDMYEDEDIRLPANLVPSLDIFGTPENKKRSIENFYKRYEGRPMHMMWAFWKHLGTNETDIINLENPWEEIILWLSRYNKGKRFIIQ